MTSQLILDAMKDGTLKIAVDAGHGGFNSTAGKRTPDGEYEWNFNNKVVIAFINHMKQYKNVQILRVDDPTGKTDVPLKTRTDKANAWGADIYISFHHNANTGKWGSWTGVETYVYSLNNAKSVELAKAVHSGYVQAMGIKDRGIKTANFHITRETDMPAILLEGGYMDSSIDIKKMRNDTILNNSGIAIADGIAKHFNLILTKPEFVEPIPTEEVKGVSKVKQVVSDTHKEAWEWAKVNKLMNGENPKNPLTREQFATVLKRLYDDLNK